MDNIIQKEIKKITNLIVKNYQPEKIILFGSAARGEYDENSDLDFFIVKKSKKSKLDRMREVYKLVSNLNYQIPFEPIVYTPEEVKERMRLGDFFIKTILKEGRILYETS